MSMLLLLHSNPLEGQEFESLIPLLQQKGYQPVLHKRPVKGSKLEPLLQSINSTAKVSGGGPFTLVAYSWGAYLALAYLNRFPENVKGVVLVNPKLVEDYQESIWNKIVLFTPLLRTLVLKWRSRKLSKNYVTERFQPFEAPAEVRKTLEPFLSQALVWRGAAAYKKLMTKMPLPEQFNEFKIPVTVLFGENDKISPPCDQLPILRKLKNVNEEIVPQAGHSLPWTHPQLIVDALSDLV
jgi:pimeloyl-ACP methyl ester carboxylesterase